MANPFPLPYLMSAAQIGTIFVQQYYYALQNHPFLVHQFYTNSSVALRINGGSVRTASAVSAIQELITSSNYTAIRVWTAHSMLSWQNCLHVMVSGSAQIDSVGTRRKFVQTFVLVLQEPGYFVLNDMLCFYSDQDEAIQHFSAQHNIGFGIDGFATFAQPVPSCQQNQSTLPASVPAEFNGQTQEISAQVHADQGGLPASNQSLSSPLAEVEGSAQGQVSASEQNDQQQHVSTPGTNENGQPAPHQNPSAPLEAEVSDESEGSRVENSEEDISTSEYEGDETCVFVRKIMKTVTESDIEQEFQRFGQIVPNGVKIHSSGEAAEYGYGFVKFQDSSSAQNAIKAGTTLLGGGQVTIEETRDSTIDNLACVFIRRLIHTVTESEIEQEFRKFGKIIPNGVKIHRGGKRAYYRYGFVRFQDLSAAEKAIEAGTAIVGGRQVSIEATRDNITGGKGGRSSNCDPRGRSHPTLPR